MIRRATAADASDLGHLRAALRAEAYAGDVRTLAEYAERCTAFFARALAAEPIWVHAWLAQHDGTPVGAAVLTLAPTLPRLGSLTTVDARVRDVYVAAAHRRRGIGRELMRCVLDQARALRVDRLALGTSAAGRSLYLAVGFVHKDDEMIFGSPLQ